MISNELIHRRNLILFSLVCVFYLLNVIINIFMDGLASIFAPVSMFVGLSLLPLVLILKKINPKITMYVIVCSMYIYFYYLLRGHPYLANYLFMWLALPLSAIYQNSRLVIVAGIASIILTFYAFYYLHHEIFPNVGYEDIIYLVLFGVFIATFLLIFIHKIGEVNAKLQELAYRDPLTGAANRLFLKETFEQLKAEKVQSIALLFLDMNGFKRINDTFGHEVGDQLLEKIVSRLNGIKNETDLLCRLGGDEFVVLINNIDQLALERQLERIQFEMDKPIFLNQQVLKVSASMGWSYTTKVSEAELEKMIKEADREMYKAKGNELLDSHSTDT